MTDYLISLSTQPAWIFLAIILSSYVLEDLAIISAAILATDQVISIPLAAAAVLFGIISGDIGLYILGLLANRYTGIKRRFFKNDQHLRFLNTFDQKLIRNILYIRFIPGLRFVCYTSCGLFRLHLWRFILGVSLATALWVIFVFALIYLLGTHVWEANSHWKWLLVPVALILLYFSNHHYMQRIKEI